MKILLLHNFYRNHGGEDTYVHHQLKLLEQTNHQVKLISFSSRHISPSQLPTTALHLFHHPQLNSQLDPLIQSFKPDIVHLHNIYPLITPHIYPLLKNYQLPIIQTIHNYTFLKTPFQLKPYRLLLKLSQYWHRFWLANYQLIDAFVFPNPFTLKHYHRQFSFITPNNSYLLPNFTFPPTTSPSTSRRKYYTYIGRLVPEKGLLQLLRLIPTLPQLQFLIIGQGPLESQIRHQAKHQPNLTFHSFLPHHQLSPFYFQTRFLLLPSQWLEVMPMTIIEAMAHATPAIVPQSPPLKHLIRHHFNGLLYQPNTPSKLRQTLLEASQLSPYRYRRLRHQAHQTFINRYSPQIHLKTLLSIYRQVTNSNLPPTT